MYKFFHDCRDRQEACIEAATLDRVYGAGNTSENELALNINRTNQFDHVEFS